MQHAALAAARVPRIVLRNRAADGIEVADKILNGARQSAGVLSHRDGHRRGARSGDVDGQSGQNVAEAVGGRGKQQVVAALRANLNHRIGGGRKCRKRQASRPGIDEQSSGQTRLRAADHDVIGLRGAAVIENVGGHRGAGVDKVLLQRAERVAGADGDAVAKCAIDLAADGAAGQLEAGGGGAALINDLHRSAAAGDIRQQNPIAGGVDRGVYADAGSIDRRDDVAHRIDVGARQVDKAALTRRVGDLETASLNAGAAVELAKLSCGADVAEIEIAAVDAVGGGAGGDVQIGRRGAAADIGDDQVRGGLAGGVVDLNAVAGGVDGGRE